jgi:UDP:flavonoid glycosyltransferase YjiC (YdhE family)
MKFVVAGYGSRGDIEPGAAVGVELLRRGHDVRMAVPPNMLGFVESAGLTGVPYGPDMPTLLHDKDFARKIQNPVSADLLEQAARLGRLG